MFSEQNTKSNRFISRLEQVPVKDLGAVGGFVSLDLNEAQRFKFTTSAAVTFVIGGDLAFDDESFHDYVEFDFIYTGQTITWPSNFNLTTKPNDSMLFKRVRYSFFKQNNVWTEQISATRIYPEEYVPLGNPVDFLCVCYIPGCSGNCDWCEIKSFTGSNPVACSWSLYPFSSFCTNPVCWCVCNYCDVSTGASLNATNIGYPSKYFTGSSSPNGKYRPTNVNFASGGTCCQLFYMNWLICANGCLDFYGAITVASDSCVNCAVCGKSCTYRCNCDRQFYFLAATNEGDFIGSCISADCNAPSSCTADIVLHSLKGGSWPKGVQSCQLEFTAKCTIATFCGASDCCQWYRCSAVTHWRNKCSFILQGMNNAPGDPNGFSVSCFCTRSAIITNVGSPSTPIWCNCIVCGKLVPTSGKTYYYSIWRVAGSCTCAQYSGVCFSFNIYCDCNNGVTGSLPCMCQTTCWEVCIPYGNQCACSSRFHWIDMTCDGCYLILGFAPPCCFSSFQSNTCGPIVRCRVGYMIYCRCAGQSCFCTTPCCIFLSCFSCIGYQQYCGFWRTDNFQPQWTDPNGYTGKYLYGSRWVHCNNWTGAIRYFGVCFSSSLGCWMLDTSCVGETGYSCCTCTQREHSEFPSYSMLNVNSDNPLNGWNSCVGCFCGFVDNNLGCRGMTNPYLFGPVKTASGTSQCGSAFIFCYVCCQCNSCTATTFRKRFGYPYIQGSLLCDIF